MANVVMKVVAELVEKSWAKVPRPLTEDVIDDVLATIEKSIHVKKYRNLCEHFGEKTVNQMIGLVVKNRLTPKVIRRVTSEKNTLPKTYSKLKFEP